MLCSQLYTSAQERVWCSIKRRKWGTEENRGILSMATILWNYNLGVLNIASVFKALGSIPGTHTILFI